MIEVNERVDVASMPQTVWKLLSDPHAVVDCVPGATLGEQQEDGSYDATIIVKFGLAKVSFRVRFSLELDEQAMTGQVTARGKDNQGGTRIRATMNFKVIEQTDPPGASIPIEAKLEVTGRLAMVVEAGASIVTKSITAEFSKRLAERCAGTVAT